MQISVIIPAYNREAHIGAAIESVLAQTEPPHEIIVVDNNSTDRTRSIANGYIGVRIVSELRQGSAIARNTGVQAAFGDWLAFLDSDDLWVAEKLKLQTVALRQQPDIRACFGMSQNFADPDTPAELLTVAMINTKPIAANAVSSLLIRRDLFDEIGGFDETLQSAEYIEWYSRFQDSGAASIQVPEVLHLRRIHADNKVGPGKDIPYSKVLKTILERRRSAGGNT